MKELKKIVSKFVFNGIPYTEVSSCDGHKCYSNEDADVILIVNNKQEVLFRIDVDVTDAETPSAAMETTSGIDL